jgi:hypothetical protein
MRIAQNLSCRGVVAETIEGTGLRRTAIDGVKKTLGAPQ